VLTGELYGLAAAVVAKKFTMTKNDATRIGKNFGYMIRNLYKLNGDEGAMIAAGKAVIEHQFDNHEHCTGWCPRKRMTQEQREASERFYRNKNKDGDAKLYSVLSEKVGRFITLPRLQECSHRMDTQVNESFNNIVAWMAPKNKVYCGSCSLSNRIGLAIAIKSVGLLECFKRLFMKLGIRMTPNVVHYLKWKDTRRSYCIAKVKTKEHKKARLKGRFDKQREDEQVAKKERSKRDGTYKSGQAVLNDGEEEQQPAKKKSRKELFCWSCNQPGHATTRSKACANHVPTKAKANRRAVVDPPPGCVATCGYGLTDADQAEDVANFDTFAIDAKSEEEDNAAALLGVATQRDDRIYDSDGDDLYDCPPSGGHI
jgi:hypothetical protein